MQTIGTFGVPFAITLDGSRAYVANGAGGLVVMDVSNPAAPYITGYVPLAGTSYDVSVSGSFAYVAAQSGGLHVVDITNPFHPFRVGTLQRPGLPVAAPVGVTIAGSLQYVADRSFGLVAVPTQCENPPTSVADPFSTAVSLNPIRPTPARDEALVSFALARRTPLRVDVYDVAGKKLRSLFDGVRGAGSDQLAWDTRDDAGVAVPNGVYFIRVHWDGGQSTARATILR